MNLKKLFATVLTMMCLVTSQAIPSLANQLVENLTPPIEGATEMVVNGGFEDVDTAKLAPRNWKAYNSQNVEGYEWIENKVSMLETKDVYSGNYSLRVDQRNSLSDIGYASQYIEGLKKGVTYQASFWAKAETDNPQLFFYYEMYRNPPGEFWGGASRGNTVKLEGKEWKQYVYNFTLEEDNIDYIRYYVMVQNGVIIMDELSLVPIGLPPHISVEANERYYYTDLERGVATVFLNDFYKDEEPLLNVDIALMDGETVLASTEGLSFENEKIEWWFNPQVMTDREKAYQIVANLTKMDGTPVQTASYRVERRYDRPEGVTKDGKFLNDEGVVYMPITAYEVYDHIEGEAIFDECRRMGVNVVHGIYDMLDNPEGARKRLDYLQSQGFKVIACIYLRDWMPNSPEIKDKVIALVEYLKGHPAIFAWNLCDEPVGKGFNEEMMEEAYRMVRDIDPIRPTYYGDQTVFQLQRLYRYCDVVGADNYSYNPAAPFTKHYLNFWDKMMPVLKLSGKAVVDDLQTFKRSEQPNSNQVYTYDSIRNSIYQNLFSGVTAFGYYNFNTYALAVDEEGNRWFNSGMGFAVEDWLKNEQELCIDYFIKEKYPMFTDVREDKYAMHAFVKDGDIYCIVINNSSTEALEAEIPLVSLSGKVKVGSFKGEALYGLASADKDVSASDGILRAKMAPYETVMYKITPSSSIDTALLAVEKEEEAPIQSEKKYSVTDLSGYEWAAEAVDTLYKRGVVDTKVQNSYEPAINITRADFASYLVRALRLSADSPDQFADVSADAPYAKDVAVAKALGVVNGVDGVNFMPDAPITRQDVMTICQRGMAHASKIAPAEITVLDAFSDKAEIAEYAVDSVSALVGGGIVLGDGTGKLNPLSFMTRAEAASMLHKVLQAPTVSVPSEGGEAEGPKDEVITFENAMSDDKKARADKAAKLLTALGAVLSGDMETSMTTAQFEAALSGLLGYEVNEFSDKTKAVTTEEAVKECIDLLGYTVYIGRDGGILPLAYRMGLTDGVDASGAYMKAADIYLMLENMLDIKTVDREAYGEGASGVYAETENTFAKKILGLDKYKGEITSNYYVSTVAGASCAKDEVVLGGKTFEIGETDAAALVGHEVIAYADKEDVLKAVVSGSTEYAVKGTDVLPKTTKTAFRYEKEGKDLSLSIAQNAKLVANNTPKDSFAEVDLTAQDSMYTLIESGGEVKVIFKNTFATKIIKSINKVEEKIYFKDGTNVALEETEKVIFEYADGKPAAVADCAEWDVISILYDAETKPIRVILSKEKLLGMPSEISDTAMTVSGKEYKISEFLKEGNAVKPEVGTEARFSMDFLGEVVAVNLENTQRNYAYTLSSELTTGLSPELKIRIMTQDGTKKVFTFAEKITFNDTEMKSVALMDADSALFKMSEGKRTVVQQLVRYEKNDADEITAIETAMDGKKMTVAEIDGRFAENFYIPASDASTTGRFNGYNSSSLATKYHVTPGLPVFIVPSKPSTNDDDYGVSTGGSYFAHDGNYGDCWLYDVDKNNDIGAFVIRDIVSTEVTISDLSVGVVQGIVSKLDADGMPVNAITLVSGATKKTIILPDEVSIEYTSAKSISNTRFDTKFNNKTISAADLNIGDVIQYATNGRGDTFTALAVRFRAEYPVVIQKAIHTGNTAYTPSEYYNYYSIQYSYSPVTRVIPDGLIIQVPVVTNGKKFERVYNVLGGRVVLCDGERGTVTQISANDIMESDNVFILKNNTDVLLVVVYRNMD